MTARPRLAWPEHHAYLAAATVHLVRLREEAYPRAIAGGRMTADAAAAKLELSRCLVAQWRWATNPAHTPLPPHGDAGRFGAWPRQLRDELAESARKTRAKADAHPADTDAAELADLVDALLWYQQPGHPGSGDCRLTDDILFYHSINHAARCHQSTPLKAAA